MCHQYQTHNVQEGADEIQCRRQKLNKGEKNVMNEEGQEAVGKGCVSNNVGRRPVMGGRRSGGAHRPAPLCFLLAAPASDIRMSYNENAIRFQQTQGRFGYLKSN